MLKKILCLSLSCLFLFGGCKGTSEPQQQAEGSTSADTEEVTFETEAEQANYYDSNFPPLEEVQAMYPDKTILVWVIEPVSNDAAFQYRTKEVNEYLDSMGYDFAVSFRAIEPERMQEPPFTMKTTYMQEVEEAVKNGEQLDIIHSSFSVSGEPGCKSYHKYIYNGLFEPLDEYFKTELGQKLYDIMPEKHWSGLRVNGSIYGVDGMMTSVNFSCGYYYNTELLKKYSDFDVARPLSEQIDVLKEIKENEKCCIVGSFSDYLGCGEIFTQMHNVTDAVYWDDDAGTARCVLDNDKYTAALKAFYDLRKEGLISNYSASDTNFFACLTFAPGGCLTKCFDFNCNGNVFSVTPVFSGGAWITQSFNATGICTASKHKEMAFQLLALVQTDPYLNNLLTYGLEGTDYKLVEGIPDTIHTAMNQNRFANKMICYPTGLDTYAFDSAEALRSVVSAAAVSESLDFAFDGRGTEEATKKTNAIIDEIGTAIFSDEYADFDALLAAFRERLDEAGIQEIIDQCNKQYEAWRKSE